MKIKEIVHRYEWNIKMLIANRNYEYMTKRMIALCSIVLFLIAGVRTNHASARELQEGIADEIIRFHVIANSDSEEDQEVKLKVKDAVVTSLRKPMEEVESKEQAREILMSQLDQIKRTAEQTLRENGFDETVTVHLEDTYFPIKSYGDVTLPEGIYEALCIRIGEALGHNWWCIVFPTLCFVDCTHGYVPDDSKEQLKYVLDEEEYDSVLTNRKKPKVKVRVRSKFIEHLKNYR